ncbi:hypothetical protein [Micrococcus luteus]
MSHPDEPELTDAEEDEYRLSQADYDGHLPDEPADDEQPEDNE